MSVPYRMMLSDIPLRQKELLYAVAGDVRAHKIMGVDFLRRHSLASSSAVQTAAAKLTSMELLAVRDGVYYVPDILLRMFLQRLMNPQKEFFENVLAAADESSEGVFPGRIIRRWCSCRGRGR